MVSIPVRTAQPGTTSAACWPPDDTEESVVGTHRHQMEILNLRFGINEAARAEAGDDQPLPWQALSQTMVTGFERPDSSSYTTLPDVFVYRQMFNPDRASLNVTLDGPPELVIEIASESTYTSDLDPIRGKAFSYARGGVREYLILDPTGIYLPEFGRGWRLQDGVYQPWRPDEHGRWQSARFPLAFAVELRQALVFGPGERRQLREGEITVELARRDAEVARKDAELAQKDDEIAELRRRLEERDAH